MKSIRHSYSLSHIWRRSRSHGKYRTTDPTCSCRTRTRSRSRQFDCIQRHTALRSHFQWDLSARHLTARKWDSSFKPNAGSPSSTHHHVVVTEHWWAFLITQNLLDLQEFLLNVIHRNHFGKLKKEKFTTTTFRKGKTETTLTSSWMAVLFKCIAWAPFL